MKNLTSSKIENVIVKAFVTLIISAIVIAVALMVYHVCKGDLNTHAYDY